VEGTHAGRRYTKTGKNLVGSRRFDRKRGGESRKLTDVRSLIQRGPSETEKGDPPASTRREIFMSWSPDAVKKSKEGKKLGGRTTDDPRGRVPG